MQMSRWNKKGLLAISEVFILLISLVAMTFMIAWSSQGVSASDICNPPYVCRDKGGVQYSAERAVGEDGECYDKYWNPCPNGCDAESGKCNENPSDTKSNSDSEVSLCEPVCKQYLGKTYSVVTSKTDEGVCEPISESPYAGSGWIKCLSGCDSQTGKCKTPELKTQDKKNYNFLKGNIGNWLIQEAYSGGGSVINKNIKKLNRKSTKESCQDICADDHHIQQRNLGVPNKDGERQCVNGKKVPCAEKLVCRQGKCVSQEQAEQIDKNKTKEPFDLKAFFTDKSYGNGWTQVGYIVTAAAIAAGVAYGTYTLAKALDSSDKQAKNLAYNVGGGVLATELILKYTNLGGGYAALIGLGAAAISTMITYKKEATMIVNYNCMVWNPQSGGDNCELCNKGDIPCSEYQCRSLGESCQIVNKGTKDQKCVNINPKDIVPPKISADEGILLEGYRYEPLSTNFPLDRGVKLVYTGSQNGCVPPFTNFPLGITVDEPAHCKYDMERLDNYSDMNNFFSNGLMLYNHSVTFNFPDKVSMEQHNLTFNEGENRVYVRCKDSSGNTNIANFVFEFCVDPSPDLRPPIILATNPLNGAPIAFNTSEVKLNVYLNKPSDCAWGHTDGSFDILWDANPMNCAQDSEDSTIYNNQIAYKCSTSLTGIQNYKDNVFYIRCKSYPKREESERVETSQSLRYVLKGTYPLVIDEVGPTGTIKDSAQLIPITLTAKTSGGYEEGKSWCSFSEDGSPGSFVLFINTGSYEHSQELYLAEGDYNYTIKCCDLANNCDIANAVFTADTDTESPTITRAYYEQNQMNLITDEEATCTYSTKSCNYNVADGTRINSPDGGITHILPWDTTTDLFVKCEDKFGNMPAENQCSIIVRAYDQSSSEEQNL